MSHHDELYTWIKTVSTHLPHLRGPQAYVLALWSFGTAVAGTCGRTTVACFLALVLQRQDRAVDQQLREWYCQAKAKKGPHRQTLPVSTCFASLAAWVLSLWPAQEMRLAVALDATTLGQRFTVLAVCLLYRATAIPIAWVVLPAAQPGAWRPHWCALLHHLRGCLPRDWTVVVMADRGLYASWLQREIRHQGWHPFLRINPLGYYRRRGERVWRALKNVVRRPGEQWCGEIYCFKKQVLPCTLVARWDPGYAEPWLVLTDLRPDQAEVGWYALRTWIECSFKTAKRGAWQWQATRMDDAERASRLWLVLAVATLWTVAVGGAAEASHPVSNLSALPARHIARRRASGQRPPRKLSVVRRGRLILLAQVVLGQAWPSGAFAPEPWPHARAAPIPELKT